MTTCLPGAKKQKPAAGRQVKKSFAFSLKFSTGNATPPKHGVIVRSHEEVTKAMQRPETKACHAMF